MGGKLPLRDKGNSAEEDDGGNKLHRRRETPFQINAISVVPERIAIANPESHRDTTTWSVSLLNSLIINNK